MESPYFGPDRYHRIEASDIIDFPIRHARSEIPDYFLAFVHRDPQTRLRARSLMVTRHSVTVADAGPGPHSISVEEFSRGENTEIISPSNLTRSRPSPILRSTECLRYGITRWLRETGAILIEGVGDLRRATQFISRVTPPPVLAAGLAHPFHSSQRSRAAPSSSRSLRQSLP